MIDGARLVARHGLLHSGRYAGDCTRLSGRVNVPAVAAPATASPNAHPMQPVVELRPGGTLEVAIRYITRAQDRFDARSRP